MKSASPQGAPTKPEILVVAALLWRASRLLVQQRPAHVSLPLLWEFPGGKVEPNETCEAALARECREELGVQVDVGAFVEESTDDTPRKMVRLRFYHAALVDDAATIDATSAVQWAWLTPAEMLALDFCPADVPLIRALAAGTVKAP